MLITAIRPFRPVLPEETYIYIARSIRFAETGVARRGAARLAGVLIIIGALPATHKRRLNAQKVSNGQISLSN